LSEISARIALAPGNGALLLRRAAVHGRGGDIDSALADLDLAAKLPGGGAVADLRAGLMLMEAQRYEAAVEKFDRVVSAEPRSVAARREKAKALFCLGRRAEAAAIFEALFGEADGIEPQTYLDYAELLSGALSADARAAIEVLDRGMRRLGPVPSLTTLAVDLEERLGRYGAALRHLDAAIASASRKDWWWRRKGEILERAGRRCQAASAFRAAMASIATLHPDVQRTPAFVRASAELAASLAKADPSGRCSRAGHLG
jgi:tetratricopeptide (TPR) repeat protein